jgi:hypothetical protein
MPVDRTTTRSTSSRFSKNASSFSSLGDGHMALGHCCSMSTIVSDDHSRLSIDNVTKPVRPLLQHETVIREIFRVYHSTM